MLLTRTMKKMIGLFVLMIALSFGNQAVQAQGIPTQGIPILPVLKFADDNPPPTEYTDLNTFEEIKISNGTFYPDQRIWVRGNTANSETIIHVPVLMKNCFVKTGVRRDLDSLVEPIRSFRFKVQFDARALEYLGVGHDGPLAQDTFSLAKNFVLSDEVAVDTTYQSTLLQQTTNQQNGRRVMIFGSSSQPLPPSDGADGPVDVAKSPNHCDDRIFQELLYLRFRVKWTAGAGNQGANTTLIMPNDSISYNNKFFPAAPPAPYQVTGVARDGQIDPAIDGLEGVYQPNQSFFAELSEPGVLYVRMTDSIPAIGFGPSDQQLGLVDAVDKDKTQWELRTPIIADSSLQDYNLRILEFLNLVSLSRLTDLKIESDQPWLLFQVDARPNVYGPALAEATAGISPSTLPTNLSIDPTLAREWTMRFIDNGILGSGNSGIPKVDGEATVTQTTPRLILTCLPDLLPTDPFEGTGRYIGYITVSSKSALFSPVRLKVEFINFRSPNEPNVDNTPGRGIRLVVENSRGETNTLLLGTGDRATDDIDELYGEEAAQAPLPANQFGVRWHLDHINPATAPNGLGNRNTVAANNDVVSRDIRDRASVNNDSTLIFLARFNAGVNNNGSPNYPIVVSYDISDFPEGAQLVFRDTLNGNKINVNMRNATNLNPPNGTQYAITINDAEVRSFVIEYTTPRTTQIPDLQVGWNLVSLPVRPSNPLATEVYKGANLAPVFYDANQYKTEPNGILRFGVGYFVYYALQEKIDNIIAGVSVNRIGANTSYRVRVQPGTGGQPGWNAIGALSIPVNTSQISIDATAGTPDRVGLVYKYSTNEGYQEVSTLEPGFGYWIQVEGGEGFVNLSNARATTQVNVPSLDLDVATKIVVRDNSQKTASLFLSDNENVRLAHYNLPPLPPAGLFDVRFATNRKLEIGNDNIVLLNGVTYPVAVEVQNASSDIIAVNAVTGEEVGTFNKANSTIIIADENVTSFRLQSAGNGSAVNTLLGNDPNPVEDKTTISYNVANDSFVSLKVYNVMGQEVATLVDSFQGAGTYEQTLDTRVNNLVNGTYVYRLQIGDFVQTRTMKVFK